MRRSLLLLLLIIQGCTVYSSQGRRDFESKSPDYVKTQALVGCQLIDDDSYEQGFSESFWSRTFYHDDNFWVAKEGDNPNFIQVFDTKGDEVCSYHFKDEAEWNENKEAFLKNLK